MFGIFSQIQGWVKLKGATDGTKIGNVGDSLKTDVTASALPSGASTASNQLSIIKWLEALTGLNSNSHHGILTTSTTTGDQQIIAYTVPAGKDMYLTGYMVSTSNVAGTLAKIVKGTAPFLETSNPGTTNSQVYKAFQVGAASSAVSVRSEQFAIPRKFATAGETVRMTVTPAATQSTTWRATLDFILVDL